MNNLLSRKQLNKPPALRRQQFDTWLRANSANVDSM
jgi:hypothetical protein